MSMKFDVIVNGPLEVNTYLVFNGVGECYLIDPGYDGDKIYKIVKKHDVKVKAILLTHGHFDHIGATNYLVNLFKSPVYLHPLDFKMVKSPSLNYSIAFNQPISLDVELSDITKLNNPEIEIIHTPGHSKGSISIYFKKDKLLFSGDTLFNKGVGRTDLYGGNEVELNKSINKLLLLDEDVMVLPGHGEATTILEEKLNRSI